jgi:hypothetical protein
MVLVVGHAIDHLIHRAGLLGQQSDLLGLVVVRAQSHAAAHGKKKHTCQNLAHLTSPQ